MNDSRRNLHHKEARVAQRLGRQTSNPEVPGSPSCHYLDFSSVAPNSNPTRFVYSQHFCLLPVGFLIMLFSFEIICFLCFSGMPCNQLSKLSALTTIKKKKTPSIFTYITLILLWLLGRFSNKSFFKKLKITIKDTSIKSKNLKVKVLKVIDI